MESRAKFLGHPIHQMLIVFPLGLFISAVIFDIACLVSGNTLLATVAYYNILFGVIMGLVAAIFGFRDWLAIPGGTRAKSVGARHGIGNVVVTLLMAASWLLRANSADFIPGTFGYILSFAGVMLGSMTAWLGGELVDRLGVGVDPGANLNAPSSLSGQPAADLQAGRMAAVPVTGEDKYHEKQTDKHSAVVTPDDMDLRLTGEDVPEADDMD